MDDNKKFWERTAKLYGPIQEHSNQALYNAVIEACRPYVTGETKVLELACGSGQVTKPLSPLAFSWEATDFSPKMVEETKKRCPGVHCSVEDCTNLPYLDGCFDLAVIANALHIMPEPRKALGEIARVLRPGGVILAPTFVYEGHFNKFRMKLTELVGFKTYEHWTLADLCKELEDAGFAILEQRLLPGDPLPEGFAAARKL